MLLNKCKIEYIIDNQWGIIQRMNQLPYDLFLKL